MIAGTGAPVTVRLRGRLDDLQPKLRRIAEIVLQDPSAASGLSIGALAAEAGCSEATVVRFATELGYSGYREFRRNLLHEAAIADERTSRGELQGDIDPDDDLATVVGKIAVSDARAVEDTAQALDIATLAEVAHRISAAPRITVFGIGASGLAAQDLQQKLMRLGLSCSAHQDVHEALMVASLLTPGCVTIGISNTGQTAEVIESLRLGAEVGATAVAITNAPSSPLAQCADHLLVTAAQESLLRSGATASRIAQLTVIDCILVAVARCLPDLGRTALETTRAAVERRSR